MHCFGTEQEFNLLKSIHKEVMKNSVEQSFGIWNDDFQKKLLKEKFSKNYKTLKFILYQDQIIGTINLKKEYLEDIDKSIILIENFYIYEKFQGLGLGTKVLEELKHHQMRLFCLKKNEKVIHFYLKNNFKIYQEDHLFFYMQKIQ